MEDVPFSFAESCDEANVGDVPDWTSLGEDLFLIDTFSDQSEAKPVQRSSKKRPQSNEKPVTKRPKNVSAATDKVSKETLLKLSSADLSLEEMEAMLAGDPVETTISKTESVSGPDNAEGERTRGQLSRLMSKVWVRACKDAIDASIHDGLEAYEAAIQHIVGVTQTWISVFLTPSDYESMRVSLRSIGIEAHQNAQEFRLDPSSMELLTSEEEGNPTPPNAVINHNATDDDTPLAMVKIYRKEWRKNNKTAMYINKEAQNLFGYSPNEFFKLWTSNGTQTTVKTPLWAYLLAEEDWEEVAENGCRDLLKLPRKEMEKEASHSVHIKTKDGSSIKCMSSTKVNHVELGSSKGPHSFSYCFVSLNEDNVEPPAPPAPKKSVASSSKKESAAVDKKKQKRAQAAAALASTGAAWPSFAAGAGPTSGAGTSSATPVIATTARHAS